MNDAPGFGELRSRDGYGAPGADYFKRPHVSATA